MPMIGIFPKRNGPPPNPDDMPPPKKKDKGKPGVGIIIAAGGPKPGTEPEEEAGLPEDEGGKGVTFKELGFRGGEETCGSCQNFDGNDMCSKVGAKIPSADPASSYCHAYTSGGAEEANPNEAEPDNDADDQVGRQ